MRTLTKWFIIAIASPFILVGATYEFIKEAFHAGQMRYARVMETIMDWVEGD